MEILQNLHPWALTATWAAAETRVLTSTAVMFIVLFGKFAAFK
jgi:hypothetical protein